MFHSDVPRESRAVEKSFTEIIPANYSGVHIYIVENTFNFFITYPAVLLNVSHIS